MPAPPTPSTTRTETGQLPGASPGGRDMRTRLIVAAAVAALLVLAAGSEAQKPPKAGNVSLKASPAQVTFSTPVALMGKVKGAKAGIVVSLERRAADATAFVPAGTA